MSKISTKRVPPDAETRVSVECALGRIFRLLSRPAQPGDVEQYEAARRVILDSLEPGTEVWRPDYARDRGKGAAGD
jgi:hypothetical protein